MTMTMTATQVRFFREQGYLLLPGLLEPALLQQARDAAEGEFRNANDPSRRREGDIMEPGDTAVYRLSKMLDRGPAFSKVAFHPRVVDAVTGVLGPGARVCTNRHNMLIAKAPRVGAGFCWHQDGFSWGHNNLVTLMVLLDEATKENGCLRIVPGIHRGYLANVPAGPLQWCMDEEDPEVKDLVGQSLFVEAAPGDAILFHCLTPHHSAPNRSDRGRRSLSFAYVAARDTWLHHPQKDAIASLPLER
jgi:phytanoyl-CoA hydroxylase